MAKSFTRRASAPAQRAGFTLIELLVAIGIIGLLVSILVPAVASAIASARDAEVRNELNQLEAALADFKNEYGTYPPSRITLFEQGSAWTTTSKAQIRKIWPKFDFSTTLNRDINQDGDDTDVLVLGPAETLMFFLGGIIEERAAGKFVTLGFSKNPADPFDPDGSRVGPFQEFNPDRIANSAAAGNFYVYFDAYDLKLAPLLYFSSDEGVGYDVGREDTPISDVSLVRTRYGDQAFRDVYRQDFSFSDDGGTLKFVEGTDAPPWKPSTFQLISPGRDGEYGIGGYFVEDIRSNQPASVSATDWSAFLTARQPDEDNIVNFKGGKLN